MRWVRVLVAARALWADEWAADEDRVLWCGGEDEGGILFSRETITRGLSEACEDKGLESVRNVSHRSVLSRTCSDRCWWDERLLQL